MLGATAVGREIVAYRMKLLILIERFRSDERSPVGLEARNCADALTCLMEEAPLRQRPAIDYLIDRYESLRASCLS
jgi:hypothetical protein